MFEAIGTLYSYTKQYQLKKSAKQKVTTGEAFDWKDARSSFVKAQEPRRTAPKSFVELSLEKSKKDDDRTAATKKSGIKQKLRRGKKLSPQELEYLRRHDEELYEKAKTTMEEREKLARALKSAKTKAEAQRAVAIAYANAAASLTGNIGGGGGAAGGSSGGGEAFGAGDASGTTADAAVNAEDGAAALDAGVAAGTENVSAETVSAGAAGATAGTESTAADAVGNEADAGREMEADVAQENKDATATLQQTSQDTEFDDPLILLVLRHLQAEWRDFMKSEQYKEMPEDELQAAKRLDAPQIRQRSEAVKAVSLTAAAAAYQTAAEK